MDNNKTFKYNYSAEENEEIKKLRNKYLPQKESKLDELKRLDRYVQNSGAVESLCTGIGGALVFGLGMCLTMHVIGSGVLLAILGVLLGVVGVISMLFAYPLHRSIFSKTKAKYAPRILELTAELSGEKI